MDEIRRNVGNRAAGWNGLTIDDLRHTIDDLRQKDVVFREKDKPNSRIVEWNNLTMNDLRFLGIDHTDFESVGKLLYGLAYWSYSDVQPATYSGITEQSRYIDIVKLQFMRNINVIYQHVINNKGKLQPSNLYRVLFYKPLQNDIAKTELRKRLSTERLPLNPWKSVPQNSNHVVENFISTHRLYFSTRDALFVRNPYIPDNWSDNDLDSCVRVYLELFHNFDMSKIKEISNKIGFEDTHPVIFLFMNISYVFQQCGYNYLGQFKPFCICNELIEKIKKILHNCKRCDGEIDSSDETDYSATEKNEIENIFDDADNGQRPDWTGHKERQEMTTASGTDRAIPKRNLQRAADALIRANYKCEYDSNDRTFLRQNGKPYTEPHHLIPLRCHKEFEYSVDVMENIVSLCSHCHNLLHYGRMHEKEAILYKLFNERKDALSRCGLAITFEKLLSFY